MAPGPRMLIAHDNRSVQEIPRLFESLKKD